MIRVGILSFSDGRARVHDTLKDYIATCEDELRRRLEATGEIEVIASENQVCTNDLAQRSAFALLAGKPDACIFNVPVFAFPNFAAIAARALEGVPLLAYSPANASYPGLGGLQAAVGMIRQALGQCEKVWGALEDEAVFGKIMDFLHGAYAVSRLKGQVYGLFGGRSIGMGSGAVSPDVWMKQFGVDIEHIDQMEILRRANLVPPEQTERAQAWLEEFMGAVAYDGQKLTPESLRMQINCYIALKELIGERGLSFVGVKCHYDLSEYFVTQCLSAALCNDPYDWDGAKEPVVFACEADSDAALTMQVLKLVSNLPVLFMDFRHFMKNENLFTFCNCGACATWYAAKSAQPAENLRRVALCPVIPKYGGNGCHVQFMAASGPMTFARMTHQMDRYVMQAFEGTFETLPPERMRETCAAWPHGYASVRSDPIALLDRFASNHIHAVSGAHLNALRAFCKLTGVEFEAL